MPLEVHGTISHHFVDLAVGELIELSGSQRLEHGQSPFLPRQQDTVLGELAVMDSQDLQTRRAGQQLVSSHLDGIG